MADIKEKSIDLATQEVLKKAKEENITRAAMRFWRARFMLYCLQYGSLQD
jgi:hypothetical protein